MISACSCSSLCISQVLQECGHGGHRRWQPPCPLLHNKREHPDNYLEHTRPTVFMRWHAGRDAIWQTWRSPLWVAAMTACAHLAAIAAGATPYALQRRFEISGGSQARRTRFCIADMAVIPAGDRHICLCARHVTTSSMPSSPVPVQIRSYQKCSGCGRGLWLATHSRYGHLQPHHSTLSSLSYKVADTVCSRCLSIQNYTSAQSYSTRT